MGSSDVWILGIAMTKFGKHPDKDVFDLAADAVYRALADAGVGLADIGLMAGGNVFGSYCFTQALQKHIGQTGVPAYNVENACATGATAVRVAAMALKSGEVDMALAVGVEKVAGAGLLAGGSREPTSSWEPQGRIGAVGPTDGEIGTETMPGVFAQIGTAYQHRYGNADFELFARISEKNHAHSTLNPLAAYQKQLTLEEIMNDVMVAYPNTRPMCSANCDGAAAAVLVSGSRLGALSAEQRRRAVKVSASVLASDPWDEGCHVLPNVNTVTRNAAAIAYESAGIGPEDLDLVELHDCFATAELVHYDNLMLCQPGGAVDYFNSGATTRDGVLPVNVSGGLESKGHPVSATGIANLWEVATHLRAEAGPRQIEGARVGMTHVIGIGAACAVHILERAHV